MLEADPFIAFLARFFLVLIFPLSALNEIFDYGSAMAQASQGWILLPTSLAMTLLILGSTLEIVGPIGIWTVFYRGQLALLFTSYVITTSVLFRNFWSFPFNGNDWNNAFWPFVKNIGLAGGFLYIAADARVQSSSAAFSRHPFGPK